MSSQDSTPTAGTSQPEAAQATLPLNGGTPPPEAASPSRTAPSPLRLPEANEFSPGQIPVDPRERPKRGDLRGVLAIVARYPGDRAAILEAIRRRYFPEAAEARTDPAERLKQQQTRASNVLIGMRGYRLLTSGAPRLTEIGEQLLAEPDDTRMREAFARHILRRCHGLEVLQAVRDIQARQVKVSKLSLADELRRHGFQLPRGTTHHTKLLQWLREANVIDAANNINEAQVSRLAGVSLAVVGEWVALPRPQRAFLTALRKLAEVHGGQMIPTKTVVDQAQLEQGSLGKEDQLRANVYQPLEQQGWLSLSPGAGGRGGKSGFVAATSKLLDVDLEALAGYPIGDIPADLRAKLNTPLDKIYEDLRSKDTHTKGIALELLALRIAIDLGLTPLRFRERSAKTGGAEVDLIAEGAHLHFSRWLFQCKNVRTVALSDLAKEVGMAVLLKGHVVVMVTTGRFAASVAEYAEELARTTVLQVVLVDGTTLAKYKEAGAAALMSFFHDAAADAMRLKRPQVLGSLDAADTDI
jgi:Restriction endonuclease